MKAFEPETGVSVLPPSSTNTRVNRDPIDVNKPRFSAIRQPSFAIM